MKGTGEATLRITSARTKGCHVTIAMLTTSSKDRNRLCVIGLGRVHRDDCDDCDDCDDRDDRDDCDDYLCDGPVHKLLGWNC